jgi:hypothetical protein
MKERKQEQELKNREKVEMTKTTRMKVVKPEKLEKVTKTKRKSTTLPSR